MVDKEELDQIILTFKKVVESIIEALKAFFETVKTIAKRFFGFVRSLWRVIYPERAHKMRKKKRYDRFISRYYPIKTKA